MKFYVISPNTHVYIWQPITFGSGPWFEYVTTKSVTYTAEDFDYSFIRDELPARMRKAPCFVFKLPPNTLFNATRVTKIVALQSDVKIFTQSSNIV